MKVFLCLALFCAVAFSANYHGRLKPGERTPSKPHPDNHKCGSDEKFFSDELGAQYRFPSGGNVPKIGVTYLQDTSADHGPKDHEFGISFDKLYFANDDESTGFSYSLNSFKWEWESCDIQVLPDAVNPNGDMSEYFILKGQNPHHACLDTNIYITWNYGGGATATESMMKWMVIVRSNPLCDSLTLADVLSMNTRMGIEFTFRCHDFSGSSEPKCVVEEELGAGNYSTSLTYKFGDSGFVALDAMVFCAGINENATVDTVPTDNGCIDANTASYGFYWPTKDSDDFTPQTQNKYRLEINYGGGAADGLNAQFNGTEGLQVTFDPGFYKVAEGASIPNLVYTPAALIPNGDNIFKFPAASLHQDSYVEVDIPVNPEIFDPLPAGDETVEVEKPVVDEPVNVPEIISQEVVYDTTMRDMTLVGVVAFIGLTLALAFFFARKADKTPARV